MRNNTWLILTYESFVSPGSLILTGENIVKNSHACFAISLIYSDFKTLSDV